MHLLMRLRKTYGMLFFILLITGCSPAEMFTEEKHQHQHQYGSGFRNSPPVPKATSKGVMFVLRRIWGSAFHPEIPANHILSEKDAVASLNALKGKDTLTWLGHSTFILRVDGKTILTDPFLTERASPLSFVGGVTRYSPPGIQIENLPPVDIIIISHNHYDHLDVHTIDKFPNKKTIHVGVPLGLKDIFLESGYENIHELNWGESVTIDNIKIEALPAAHDSGRWLHDKDQTLWCTWGITSTNGKYFFGGDTGYSPVFKKIGQIYKSFDLAILPIGAYEPRELMWMSHVNPEEAIEIGLDVNAKILVAGHWGTIELSDEPLWEPPIRFMKAAVSAGIDREKTWVMKIGESRVLP